MYNFMKKSGWLCSCVLVTILTAAVTGCSWPGSYLKHDWTVESKFDGYEIFADHHYFTAGTLDDPRAILVLKPNYKLDSTDWQPVKMTAGMLEQWIEALHKDSFVEYNTFANGARVIDTGGAIAGYYYSVWAFPLVRMPTEKTLQLNVPRAEYRSTNRRIEFFVDDDNKSPR